MKDGQDKTIPYLLAPIRRRDIIMLRERDDICKRGRYRRSETNDGLTENDTNEWLV